MKGVNEVDLMNYDAVRSLNRTGRYEIYDNDAARHN